MLFIFFVFQKYVMVMEVSCLLKLNIGEGGNTFLFNFKCSRWQITNTLCQIDCQLFLQAYSVILINQLTFTSLSSTISWTISSTISSTVQHLLV